MEKKSKVSAPDTTKPRNDFGVKEFLEIASALQAKHRDRHMSRLTAGGRLRKRGA